MLYGAALEGKPNYVPSLEHPSIHLKKKAYRTHIVCFLDHIVFNALLRVSHTVAEKVYPLTNENAENVSFQIGLPFATVKRKPSDSATRAQDFSYLNGKY